MYKKALEAIVSRTQYVKQETETEEDMGENGE